MLTAYCESESFFLTKSKDHLEMHNLFRISLLSFGFAHGANAWGVLGHATVAYVAQHYLSAGTTSWYVPPSRRRNPVPVLITFKGTRGPQ